MSRFTVRGRHVCRLYVIMCFIVLALTVGTWHAVSLYAQEDNAPVITVDRATQLVELATLRGHTDAVQGVAFTPDSETLVSVGDDASLRVWQVASASEIEARFDHISFVKDLAVVLPADAEDETLRLASVGWGRTLVLHDLPPDDPAALTVTSVVEGYVSVLDYVAWSPDGSQLALTVGTGTMVVLDAVTLEEIRRFTLPSLQMNALAFSPDGDLLAASSGFPNTDVYVFDLTGDSPQPAYLLPGGDDAGTPTALAFLPGASEVPLLVSAYDLGALSLWRLDADTPAASTQIEDTWFLSLAVHPDGNMVATGDLEGNLRLWEIETQGNTLIEIVSYTIGDNTPVNDVAFSPDGTLIAVAGDDGTITLWGLPLAD